MNKRILGTMLVMVVSLLSSCYGMGSESCVGGACAKKASCSKKTKVCTKQADGEKSKRKYFRPFCESRRKHAKIGEHSNRITYHTPVTKED